MLAALAAAGTAHNIHSKMPQHDPEAWCGASLPRNVVQSTRTFVHGGRSHAVEVLQELPAVVAVRGFATAAECASLNEATDHWLSDAKNCLVRRRGLRGLRRQDADAARGPAQGGDLEGRELLTQYQGRQVQEATDLGIRCYRSYCVHADKTGPPSSSIESASSP